MNKNTIIGIVVLILLGGGYWAWQQATPSRQAGTVSDTDTTKSTNEMTSFQSLIAAGQPVTCTYTIDADGHSQNGTVYVGGGKMRADFSSPSTDAPFNGSVIRDSEYSYSWGTTAQGTFGTKMKNSSVDQTTTNQANNNLDINKPVAMHCQPWSIDETKFTPPTDIQFQDFSAQMDAMKKIKADDGSIMNPKCVACDQVSDPTAQAQCLQALGC